VREAVAAARAGCDFLSIQGIEAGGHLRGRVALDRLLLETLALVDLPVLAAGGIGSRERVEELLAAGAAGVRIGTRFLAATEADVHPEYLAALVESEGDETCITTLFEVGWPGAPHRVLCSAIGEAERLTSPEAGQHHGELMPRFSSMPPRRGTTGRISAMALYAGMSVGGIVREQAAAEIVAELMGP
jgi:NAD(P)H-dependent flavin oxidoreductase YrpB (nitropropane dioxygenase family)